MQPLMVTISSKIEGFQTHCVRRDTQSHVAPVHAKFRVDFLIQQIINCEMRSRLLFILAITLFGCAIAATRYYEIDQPVWRYLRGAEINPATLHLQGEFVESNLGSAQEPDGSITVRMIAQQYVFVPQCVVVPSGVSVRLRITSADAVHKLGIERTGYNLEAVPGAVTESHLQFPTPGEYGVPCKEFCGAGHYAMRGEFLAVPKEQFRSLMPEERVTCASR